MTTVSPPENDVRFESYIGHEWRTQRVLWRVLSAAAFIPILAIAVYAVYLLLTDDISMSAVILIATALLHGYMGMIHPRIRASRQHLTVGRRGIQQEIPLGSSWTLSWAEIRDIRLVFARTMVANGWFYEIETIRGEKKRIHPAEWRIVDADDPLYPRPGLNEWLSKPWAGREYVQRSRLHAVLGAPQPEDTTLQKPQPTVEDFLRTPRGKLVVAIVIIGCLYAFLDWEQLSNYRFLHESFSSVLWSGVVLFGASGFLLTLGRNGTEKAIAVIFMLLPGFFVPVPLALRVNAATDWDGPVIQAYVATGSGFAAADGHGRYLDMSLHARFRAGEKPRKEQNLAIYRGVLGFDQLDLDSIRWDDE